MEVVGALYQYMIPSIGIAAVIFVLWKGTVFLFPHNRKKAIPVAQWFWQYVLLVYLQGVIFLTDGYAVFYDGLPKYFMEPNWVPIANTFRDIAANPTVAIAQVLYNLVFFIPFGFLLPLAFNKGKWKAWKLLLISLITIAVVEGLEFLSGRYMDIDDFIINGLGALSGYYLWRGFAFWCGKYQARMHKMMAVGGDDFVKL